MGKSTKAPTIEQLVVKVDAYLDKVGIGETTLGRRVINDPNLVREMRAGRDLRLSTVNAIEAYMERNG